MRPGRFFWKLFLGNSALLALTLSITIWLIVVEFDRFQADQLTPYLHNHADTIAALVEHRLTANRTLELQQLVRRIASGHPEAVRTTLVAADGRVLADSQGDTATMENHLQRPEIAQALQAERGESERWSDTVSRTMKYVAVRVDQGGVPVGVVRVAMPVRTLAERTVAARRLLGPIGLIGVLAAIGMAVGLALLWSNRLRRLTAAAQSLSRGDLKAAIPVSGSDEVATLAKSLERMRTRLARQVETILRQRITLESLVAQLDEGVVVADADGRIVLVNPAAARLLGFRGTATGAIILDSQPRVESVVAPHDLQRMLLRHEQESDARPEGSSTVGDMPENLHLHAIRLDVPDSPSPAYVLARACHIPIAMPSARSVSARQGADGGRLLVLTDVTALLRAIRSRSDFVANASHELRTPVAAIRAAVETLTKVDFAQEGDAALRFANIIARQAARLEALVTDLLDLAKVESPGARFEASKIFLQRAIDDLHARWEQELNDKALRWTAEVAPEASEVQANNHLLSLVLDNLVDNANKFTPQGGAIAVRTRRSGDNLVIEISDTGCGIAPQDQQRVFERFYQVDAVRTGTGSHKRGTGLGLAIVRHAVSAMGGTVSLTSEVGLGTRVIVQLPRSAQSV
jgi:two-component system, OmpR family, phosphate regulon sensor histidine kinase PhoR